MRSLMNIRGQSTSTRLFIPQRSISSFQLQCEVSTLTHIGYAIKLTGINQAISFSVTIDDVQRKSFYFSESWTNVEGQFSFNGDGPDGYLFTQVTPGETIGPFSPNSCISFAGSHTTTPFDLSSWVKLFEVDNGNRTFIEFGFKGTA